MVRPAIAIAALIATSQALAADSGDCAIYAHERIAIERVIDPDVATADATAITRMELAIWAICVQVDEVPKQPHQGMVPATGDGDATAVNHVYASPPSNAEVCKREYVSYRESDGTVVRRGSSARVPCPLTADGKMAEVK